MTSMSPSTLPCFRLSSSQDILRCLILVTYMSWKLLIEVIHFNSRVMFWVHQENSWLKGFYFQFSSFFSIAYVKVYKGIALCYYTSLSPLSSWPICNPQNQAPLSPSSSNPIPDHHIPFRQDCWISSPSCDWVDINYETGCSKKVVGSQNHSVSQKYY
jgi:hypothetical protein